MNELYQPIETLPGVGEKRAQKYRKMGIATPYDLLMHFPRTYIDFTAPVMIADAENGEPVAVRVTVKQKLSPSFVKRGFSLYRVVVTDGVTEFLLVFYNTPYTYQAMKNGEEYYAYGKLSGGFLRREMQAPQVQRVDQALLLLPVYPQTTGLTSAMMRTNVLKALSYLDSQPVETLPAEMREGYQLVALVQALHDDDDAGLLIIHARRYGL